MKQKSEHKSSRWLSPPSRWNKRSLLFAVLGLFLASNLLTAAPQNEEISGCIVVPTDWTVPLGSNEQAIESGESLVTDLSFEGSSRLPDRNRHEAPIAYDRKMIKRHCWNEDAATGPPTTALANCLWLAGLFGLAK